MPVAMASDLNAMCRRHSGVMPCVMVVNMGAMATGSMATKKVTNEASSRESIEAV
jgi:hypothetical protein